MKSVRQNMFLLMVSLVVANLFSACSNEQTAYLGEDNLQDTKDYSVCEASFSQINNTDYEIIPIGTNSCVYVPRMTSAKTTKRSIETSQSYSATISTDINTQDYGPLVISITWDNSYVTFRLSDSYTYIQQNFVYTIRGNTISIDDLSLRIYGFGGKYLGNVNYSGKTLIGN